MNKIRILTRAGSFISMEWSYKPLENPIALKKATKSLQRQNIKGNIFEVAPECFWYSTDTKKINCGLY